MSFNNYAVSENGSRKISDTNLLSPMDGPQVPKEGAKTSNVKKPKKNKVSRNLNSKFFICLLEFLSKGEHKHMLRYVPDSNEKEFEVIFIDKKSPKWQSRDISLFEAIDKHLRKLFNRKRPLQKYEEIMKSRFKSNMTKCVKKYIEQIPTQEETVKCKTVKRYRILRRPNSEQNGDKRIKNFGKIKKLSRNQNKTNSNIGIQGDGKNYITDGINSTSQSSHKNTFESISMNGHNIPLANEFQKDNITSEIFLMMGNCIHLKDAIQNNNTIICNGYEEKNMNNSHYLCLSANSQLNFNDSLSTDFNDVTKEFINKMLSKSDEMLTNETCHGNSGENLTLHGNLDETSINKLDKNCYDFANADECSSQGNCNPKMVGQRFLKEPNNDPFLGSLQDTFLGDNYEWLHDQPLSGMENLM